MIINLQHIDICQNNKTLIENINFQIEQGEFVYIIGNVGTGKSSLLKTLYAELPIQEHHKNSSADILDFNLKKIRYKNVPALRRKLGIIFQDFQLLKDRTIASNLDFVLKATNWKKNKRAQRVQEVLEIVGMTNKQHSMPHELSGGEQQRIAIARSLLNQPKIILADEPTGNLDSTTSYEIIEVLKSISLKGTTVIIVTHNLNIIKEFPGVVYQIKDKQISEIDCSNLSTSNLENQ